jgi:hypothetical protein
MKAVELRERLNEAPQYRHDMALSIGIFVVGFVLTTMLGQVQGVNNESTMQATSDTQFPAAQHRARPPKLRSRAWSKASALPSFIETGTEVPCCKLGNFPLSRRDISPPI